MRGQGREEEGREEEGKGGGEEERRRGLSQIPFFKGANSLMKNLHSRTHEIYFSNVPPISIAIR